MNLRERLIVILLTAKDRLMDVVTGGRWERIRGDVVPNVKVPEKRVEGLRFLVESKIPGVDADSLKNTILGLMKEE